MYAEHMGDTEWRLKIPLYSIFNKEQYMCREMTGQSSFFKKFLTVVKYT